MSLLGREWALCGNCLQSCTSDSGNLEAVEISWLVAAGGTPSPAGWYGWLDPQGRVVRDFPVPLKTVRRVNASPVDDMAVELFPDACVGVLPRSVVLASR